MRARFSRRISSSDFPENIEPAITSIQPVPFCLTLRRSSVLSNANSSTINRSLTAARKDNYKKRRESKKGRRWETFALSTLLYWDLCLNRASQVMPKMPQAFSGGKRVLSALPRAVHLEPGKLRKRRLPVGNAAALMPFDLFLAVRVSRPFHPV